MKFLRRCLIDLVYLLPAILFFSYYPVLRIGQNSSMNFELSLPLVWLVLFDLAVISYLCILGIKSRRSASPKTKRTHLGINFPRISDRRIFLLSLFPFFATLSIFWSANPLRAILTAGIIWLIFIAVFALLYVLPLLDPPKAFPRHLMLSFFVSSFIVCIFCWLQTFFDIFGADRSHTLLCLGCTYRSFGFPHPSGFAIEPQFMGNLLLAPALLSLYLLIMRKTSDAGAHNHPSKRPSATNGERTERRLACNDRPSQACRVKVDYALLSLTCFFSATLFLTFSRGAIYAYILALIVLLFFALREKLAWRFWRLGLLIPLGSFLVVLGFQGLFSAVGPTNESFVSGITKSIHHLSLGTIDLRSLGQKVDSSPAESSQPRLQSDSSSQPDLNLQSNSDLQSDPISQPDSSSQSNSSETAIFEGYVAESTNARLSLNQVALKTWSASLPRIFFGVGLGGAGAAMHLYAPDIITSPKEIVQNEAFSLLLELGLVGLLLIILGIFVLFSPRSAFWSNPFLPLFLSLLLAYTVTLNFFSGLPNALQIYLIPPLLYLWAKVSHPLSR